MKLKDNPRIKKLSIPNIDNAYIVISASKTDSGNNVKANLSFFLDGRKGIGIDWEPNYGPITRITACNKKHVHAEEHWFYPYCTGHGDWSQLDVLDHDLDKHFLSGDWVEMFKVLKLYL